MNRALLVSLLLFTACAAPPAGQWIGPGLDGAISARAIDRLLAENRLGDNENIRAMPVVTNARVTQLLVQVRDREPLHYHADSDLTVFLVRGRGLIEIQGERRAVAAGDVIHIPRGVVHAYLNRGPEVGAALVVMSPPPGPGDRVLVPAPTGK